MPISRRSKLVWLLVLAAGTCSYYFGFLLPQVRAVRIIKRLNGPYHFGGDFYPIWLTTRELLAHRSNPYSPEMTRQIQTGVFGRAFDPNNPLDLPANYRTFAYPLYADILAAPCAWLPFPAVQIAGAFLAPLLAAGSAVLWLRALGLPARGELLTVAVVLTLISYPAMEGLYALQPALAVSFLLAAGMLALRAGRLWLAGILLALASIKPQLIVILCFALLLWSLRDWRSRRSFVAGLAGTLLVLLLASYAIVPGWPANWWRTVSEYRHYTEPPLAQLAFGKIGGAALALLLALLAARVCWLARNEPAQSSKFWVAVATLLAVTVIVLPSAMAVYDHLVLLPAVFLLYAAKRETWRPLAWVGWLVISWQWIAAVLLVLAAFLWPSLRHNEFAIALPLRADAPLPFVILALLLLAALKRGANRRNQLAPHAG